MMQPSRPVLEVHQARIKVKLGCSPQERAMPQDVDVSLRMAFAELPPGCKTDRLEDSVCYAKLYAQMKQVAERQEYALIEKLAKDLYDQIQGLVPVDCLIWLRVHKLRPPVDGLLGGTAFEMGTKT